MDGPRVLRPVPEAAGGDPRFGPVRERRRPGACGAQAKGFGGPIRCQRAYQAAARLEELGGAGDVTGSQQAYPELEEAVRHLQAALADLVREGGIGGS